MNHQLQKLLTLQNGVDAAGFAKMQAASSAISKNFRNAAASTGMFEVQQLRLNSATDDYVKKLNAQKMGFREMAKQRKIAAAAYKEQLALENMTVRQGVGNAARNKGVYDVIVPKQVSADLDTAGKRLAFMNAELKSGAHQMVNWGKNTQWAGRQLMVGFTMPIAAFGAAAGVMAYQVDKELTRIAKVYDTMAQDTMGIEKELAQVRVDSLETAKQAAIEYGMAATETMNVQAELAAQGYQGADLQRTTREVMKISRLGEMDTQLTVDAATALRNIFPELRDNAEGLGDAFNYINSVENATSLTTEDFATAIPRAAAAVQSFGGDLHELGTLMVAMRSNGIGAAEGANAIKATMQRLSRPSKQIRQEWAEITGTDITEIVNSSDGLIEVFTKINNVTKDLDDNARRKAFAGLFGSYQVARMMAMTKGMGELEQGVGQVSRAFEVSQQSSKEWADTAEGEMERYRKSVSGMWDTTFQRMKLELAEVGEPFVVLATKIVKGISAVVSAFNNMPDWAKVMTAGTIGAAALAGGVLMLAGLFGNLAGQALKGVAGLTNLAAKMNIVDRESKAAQLAAEFATASYTEQANAVQLLTAQLHALTAAQAQSTAMANGTISDVYMGGISPEIEKQIIGNARVQHYEDAMKRLPRNVNEKTGQVSYRDPETNRFMDREQVHKATLLELQEEALVMNRADTDIRREGAELEAKRLDQTEKRNQKIRAGTALLAVEGALMATSLISTNETVDKYAQMAMVAGMVAPALGMAAPLVKTLGSNMATAGKAAKEAAAGAFATGKGARGAAAGAKSMAASFATAIGPVGWTVAALGAAALILYKIYDRNTKERKEALRDQKALNGLTKDYSEAMGVAQKNYARLGFNDSTEYDRGQQAKDLAADEEFFRNNAAGQSAASGFSNLDATEKRTVATQKYVEAQVLLGYSAQRARTYVEALYLAGGEGAAYANAEASRLYQTLGKIENSDYGDIVANQMAGMKETIYAAAEEGPGVLDMLFGWTGLTDSKSIEEAMAGPAKDMAGMLSNALATATSPAEAKKVMDDFEANMLSPLQDMMDRWASEDNVGMELFMSDEGIDSARELAEWWEKASDAQKTAAMDQYLMDPADMDTLMRTQKVSAAVAKEWSQHYGTTGNELDSILELQNEWNILAATMSYGEASREVAKIAADMKVMKKDDSLLWGHGGKINEVQEESAKAAINAFNLANGFKQGETFAQALEYFMGRVEDNTGGAERKAADLAKQLARGKGEAYNLASIMRNMSPETMAQGMRDGMESVQNQIADAERDALSAQHDAARDAAQNYWDKQRDAMDDRHDREQKALDNAWDAKRKGLERYWESRVEGIENAIEAEEKAEEKRKKMFEAEISRINRLADMANTNIDFNVALNEGNLDEAAKIANTAKAVSDEFILNRESERGREKSDRRIDKLEGRKDQLEKQKDKALEAFDKREERAKEHFQKMREMEKESLDARAEADMKAKEEQHEREKRSLDRILDTFLSFTPKNKKQLKAHMDALGMDMEHFGKFTLKEMGDDWGAYITDALHKGVRDAALAAQSDSMWTEMGSMGRDKLIKSLGFSGVQGWNHFMKTGEIIDHPGDKKRSNGPTGPTGNTTPTPGKPGRQLPGTMRHEGGILGGSGRNSRKGVARNFHGTHPSEMTVLAQKGEYLVNRSAAAKNKPLLDSINSGTAPDIMGGSGGGPMGMMGSMVAAMFMRGFQKNIESKVADVRAQQAMAAGAYTGSSGFSGQIGNFSIPGVKPWVLEAANYLGGKFGITSIGGVGSRPGPSDHPMGLALDFMTSDVAKGNALTAEALRLGPALDATYMIWQKRIHSFDSRGWRDYNHYSGESNPTLDHMDHVHISFKPNGRAGDLPKTSTPGRPNGLVQGPGGSFHPTGRVGRQGSTLHGSPPAIDIALPTGNKIFAVRDGVVSSSHDITGHESRARHGGLGYRSYGRVITVAHDGGGSSLYAHLSQRFAQAGQRVKAGTVIGLSGNTGYSTGEHLHFGATPSPYQYLRKGTEYVKFDNTPAVLHRGESVLTKNLTAKMHEGVDRFARGGDSAYNVTVNINGYDGDVGQLADEVMRRFKREAARAPQSRSVGSGS